MLDILMLALAAGFFLLMRAYVAFGERIRAMTLDLVLGGLVSAFLLTYLLYALIRPDRF